VFTIVAGIACLLAARRTLPDRARDDPHYRARPSGGRGVASASNELSGRVALVTGASRGIGAAIAERLAAAGGRVACVARSLDTPGGQDPGTLRDTVARIAAAGGHAVAIQGDVSDAASRAALVEACRAQLGPVDVLVNNAAAGPYRPFEKFSAKHFALTFGANVEAALHLMQLVAPEMRAKQHGWIVNISSATAELPKRPYNAFEQSGGAHLYAASKAALNRLSVGIAAELASAGVAVNTLAPNAAVITAAVRATGADKWIEPEMIEPVEAMAEAALALAVCDAKCTGRVTYSLDLLRELRREIRTLDGRAALTKDNAQSR
jgi:citronellol/citronellal dehydrogenase